jgi:fructokinase
VTDVIVVIGEALTDCVHSADGEVITEVPGGSPLNVAIGLGRLGRRVLLAARFGTDARGLAIAEHLRTSSVDLIPKAHGLSTTSTALAVLAEDGSASYEFDLRWDLDTHMVKEADYLHVHTGSIGATLPPGASAVADIIFRERARGASVSYDPNARPQIMGEANQVRGQMEDLIRLSDVVKASDEDIEWLYPGVPLTQVVSQWQTMGPSLVLVTRGPSGVSAHTATESVELPIHATTVVDTIGAGDSFMAGVLAGLAEKNLLGRANEAALRAISRDDLNEVVTFALSCAAVTVSRAGANPPTKAELETT